MKCTTFWTRANWFFMQPIYLSLFDIYVLFSCLISILAITQMSHSDINIYLPRYAMPYLSFDYEAKTILLCETIKYDMWVKCTKYILHTHTIYHIHNYIICQKLRHLNLSKQCMHNMYYIVYMYYKGAVIIYWWGGGTI